MKPRKTGLPGPGPSQTDIQTVGADAQSDKRLSLEPPESPKEYRKWIWNVSKIPLAICLGIWFHDYVKAHGAFRTIEAFILPRL
jgi:hypothetical protein